MTRFNDEALEFRVEGAAPLVLLPFECPHPREDLYGGPVQGIQKAGVAEAVDKWLLTSGFSMAPATQPRNQDVPLATH